MIVTTVVFRVGDTDRRTIKTMFFGDVAHDELPGRIAERGIDCRHQFPSSAVRVVSVVKRDV